MFFRPTSSGWGHHTSAGKSKAIWFGSRIRVPSPWPGTAPSSRRGWRRSAGDLAGYLAERPDLADAVQTLAAGPAPAGGIHNSNAGTVRGNLLQAGDIHGDISF
jgi:hypothetical protein